jgi:hypothetical protein
MADQDVNVPSSLRVSNSHSSFGGSTTPDVETTLPMPVDHAAIRLPNCLTLPSRTLPGTKRNIKPIFWRNAVTKELQCHCRVTIQNKQDAEAHVLKALVTGRLDSQHQESLWSTTRKSRPTWAVK